MQRKEEDKEEEVIQKKEDREEVAMEEKEYE